MSEIAGLVLAGGRARRMGGIDKTLAPLAGTPLIAHVLGRLAPQCATLVICASGDPLRFAPFGAPVIPDAAPDFAGPLSGLLAGLDHLASRHDAICDAVSVAADTPFLPHDLVARLAGARHSAGADIAVAASGQRTHHAIALWPVALRTALRQALRRDERRISRFIESHSFVVVDWPATPRDCFFNINTAEDLAQAETIARTLGTRDVMP